MSDNPIQDWWDKRLAEKHVGRLSDDFSPRTDKIIRTLLDEQIIKFQTTKHNILIETLNYQAGLWNANKFYSWLCRGEIVNKKTGENLSWESARPSALTMYQFDRKISQYAEDEVDAVLVGTGYTQEDVDFINHILVNKDKPEYKGMWEKFKTAYRMME